MNERRDRGLARRWRPLRRHLLGGLAAAVVLLSPPARAEAPDIFTDVQLWTSPAPFAWNGRQVFTPYPFRLVERLPDGTVLEAGDPQPNPGGPYAWAAEGITSAVRWGLMHGYEGAPFPATYQIPWSGARGVVWVHPLPTFAPGQALTRAEWASLLARALDLAPSPTPTPAFTDVSPSDGYAADVARLVAAGILKTRDYPGQRFDAKRPVTRREMAASLARAAGRSGLAASEEPRTFWDLDPMDPLAPEIGQAANLGLVRGRPDGSFAPEAALTRAEAAVAVSRLVRLDRSGAPQLDELRRVVEGALQAITAVPNDQPFPDLAPFRRYFTDGVLEFLAPPPEDGQGMTDYPGVFGGGSGINLPNLFFHAAMQLHGVVVAGQSTLDSLVPVFLGRTVAQVEAIGHGVSVLANGTELPAQFDTMLFLRRDGGAWKITDAYPMR